MRKSTAPGVEVQCCFRSQHHRHALRERGEVRRERGDQLNLASVTVWSTESSCLMSLGRISSGNSPPPLTIPTSALSSQGFPRSMWRNRRGCPRIEIPSQDKPLNRSGSGQRNIPPAPLPRNPVAKRGTSRLRPCRGLTVQCRIGNVAVRLGRSPACARVPRPP
jgi:hypothetical protein